MALADTSCHACGKSECKLLRCGRCQIVWFCNRECQVVAARQGHSGENCRTTAKATQHTDAGASCHACGNSDCKLLRCGQCKKVWFCSRECQIVARTELGHKGKLPPRRRGAATPYLCSFVATLHANGCNTAGSEL